MDLYVVIALTFVALAFDFINGFHDSANSIATVVSTRVLSPGKAVVWAAFFNFAAAFAFGTAVAKTIGSGMIVRTLHTPGGEVAVVTYAVIFSGLFGAIVWDLLTWYWGLPTSSSHALIGGYAGAAIARAGLGVILWSGWTKTLVFIVLSPAIGMAAGLTLMVGIYWVMRRVPPGRVDHWFRKLQLVSAGFFSLTHGANDAQKTMGIIAGVLLTAGYIKTFYIPFWVEMSRLRGDLPGDPVRRVADYPHDGLAHHEAPAGQRVRGRDRGRRRRRFRHPLRHPGQHHPRHHGRHRRRGRHSAVVGRAVGRRRPDHLGVAAHYPGRGRHRRGHVPPPSPVRHPVARAADRRRKHRIYLAEIVA